MVVHVPLPQPFVKCRDRTRLGPPPPDHFQGRFVPIVFLGHEVQNHASGGPRHPPGAVHQRVSVAQTLGDEFNDLVLVLGSEFGNRGGGIVNGNALVSKEQVVGNTIIGIISLFLLEIIRDTGLDVGLFGWCHVQYVRDLPPIHELVVVLGIDLASQVDRMPQGTSSSLSLLSTCCCCCCCCCRCCCRIVLHVKRSNQTHGAKDKTGKLPRN